MFNQVKYYWENKEARKEIAIEHTKKMEEKYGKEIENCIKATKIYGNTFIYPIQNNIICNVSVANMNSTQAIFDFASGKTAVLNFASYKNPGGKFIEGSRAQEESLCHDSFLYNVLKTKNEFYAWNIDHKNRGLYTNRALYTPDVIFEKDGYTQKCDVITCAAPNYSLAIKYGWSLMEQNSQALESRIKFVIDIAKENKVDTLILGAYGCGVFCQNPYEVANLFKKYATNQFKNIIYAIPEGKDNNYKAFKEAIFNKEGN